MNEAICRPTDPRENRLLAAFSEPELARWGHALEHVEMPRGQVLSRPGGAQDYAYFPTTAIVSLLYMTSAGASTETSVVGNEGVVGISLFLGGDTTLSQAVVQTAGHGYRVRSQRVKDATARPGPVLDVLLQYALAMMAQVAQTAACNRYHSVDQLYCRRLLMGLDRVPSDDLAMTQELAASLLGVRREGVTAAAHRLQRAGVIQYRRGHVAVLNRQELEQRTCELTAYTSR